MTPLRPALFILRACLGVFFAVWAIEKFVKPDTTAAIWEKFYLVGGLPEFGSYAIGALQLVMLALFIAGLFKTISYGFFMISHGLGTLLSYGPILNPYEGINHLFVAAIPVLGALVALFMLRGEDTLLTLGRRTVTGST